MNALSPSDEQYMETSAGAPRLADAHDPGDADTFQSRPRLASVPSAGVIR